MDAQILPIANIYVPVKRRATLNEETVKTLALEILEEGQKVPIQVRRDGSRFVLIEGRLLLLERDYTDLVSFTW